MHRVTLKRYSLLRIDAIGLGVCVAASVLFYIMTIQPFVARQALAAGRRNELQGQQAKAAELQDSLAAVRQRLETVQQELAESTITLDSVTHINRRVAGLTQFFSDCGLEVDDVQTGEVCSGPQYDLVPISIVGRGGYVQCMSFFHGLCTTFSDMSVVTIELSGNPSQAASGKFRFQLFWYAAPKAQGLTGLSGGLAPESQSEV